MTFVLETLTCTYSAQLNGCKFSIETPPSPPLPSSPLLSPPHLIVNERQYQPITTVTLYAYLSGMVHSHAGDSDFFYLQLQVHVLDLFHFVLKFLWRCDTLKRALNKKKLPHLPPPPPRPLPAGA